MVHKARRVLALARREFRELKARVWPGPRVPKGRKDQMGLLALDFKDPMDRRDLQGHKVPRVLGLRDQSENGAVRAIPVHTRQEATNLVHNCVRLRWEKW